jgi:hypothetical protein
MLLACANALRSGLPGRVSGADIACLKVSWAQRAG